MGNKKLKYQTLLLLTLVLGSCTSTSVVPVIPTNTVFSPTVQPVTSTEIIEAVPPSTSAPTIPITKAFLVGVNEAGAELSGSIGDSGIFTRFYLLQDEIVAFRFYVSQDRPNTNESVPAPTPISTAQLQILIYQYRTDGIYSNQPALEANLSTDVSLKDLQAKFDDCRAFAYQLVDEQKSLLWQGYFSMNPDSILVNVDTQTLMKEGGIIGYPYSLNENEAAFFHEGKYITIQEPQSGFYRLFYVYNIRLATPSLGTDLGEVTIKLFPYQDGRDFSVNNSAPIMEQMTSGVGILTIEYPIDMLRENINGDNMYYLQILDSQGNVIKDDYFVFTPYNRQ